MELYTDVRYQPICCVVEEKQRLTCQDCGALLTLARTKLQEDKSISVIQYCQECWQKEYGGDIEEEELWQPIVLIHRDRQRLECKCGKPAVFVELEEDRDEEFTTFDYMARCQDCYLLEEE